MFAALLPAVGRLIVTRASNARSAEPATLAEQARAAAPALPIAIALDLDDALDAAWRAVAAHRRRRIDFPARRRHEAGRRVVIPFESLRSVSGC